MDNTTERVVLITGANRGIGFETRNNSRGRDFMSSLPRGPGEWTRGGRRHPVCQGTRDVPFTRCEQLEQHSERREAVCGNC